MTEVSDDTRALSTGPDLAEQIWREEVGVVRRGADGAACGSSTWPTEPGQVLGFHEPPLPGKKWEPRTPGWWTVREEVREAWPGAAAKAVRPYHRALTNEPGHHGQPASPPSSPKATWSSSPSSQVNPVS